MFCLVGYSSIVGLAGKSCIKRRMCREEGDDTKDSRIEKREIIRERACREKYGERR